jgi:hypothetical protein
LFVFINRRHTRLKMLSLDGSGLWVLTKRLEKGTFHWPKSVEPDQTKLSLTPQAVALLTDGADLRGARFRPWYEREAGGGAKLCAAERISKSQPVINRIERALLRLKTSRRYLRQSLLGQAMDYALGQWTSLAVYVEDGGLEIDNNVVENAIRPTAVGKKNWLFVGDSQAGQWGAILYTIIESCRRHRIDPFAYLRDVFTRLPSMTNQQIAEVTPAAWAKAHPVALKTLS